MIELKEIEVPSAQTVQNRSRCQVLLNVCNGNTQRILAETNVKATNTNLCELVCCKLLSLMLKKMKADLNCEYYSHSL